MQGSQQKLLAFQVFTSRNASAYSRLYDVHAKYIARFFATKLSRPEDVDELTSEVFLRGWEYMTANRVDNPNAFFSRIARNLVADFYRDGERAETINDVIIEAAPSAESIVDDAMRREEAEELARKLLRLREEYRQVLQLKYFSEMPVLEIAETLQKSPNAIRVLLFRAKRALKKL